MKITLAIIAFSLILTLSSQSSVAHKLRKGDE